jgi:hypothetical protein
LEREGSGFISSFRGGYLRDYAGREEGRSGIIYFTRTEGEEKGGEGGGGE